MADIVTNPVDCEFFDEEDLYNAETDNRPLGHLLNNDLLLNAELIEVRDEVVGARTGLVTNYATLDLRLDAMENSIGSSVSASDVEDLQGHQYGHMIVSSETVRRSIHSGFLDFGGLADMQIGDLYDDFAALRTTENLGPTYTNSVMLWTGWGNSYRPIRANVNGWLVRLFNQSVGSPPLAPGNQITIGLGTAPATGFKTQFVFLEVWLEEVDKENPEFYFYGAVDTNADPATTDDHLHPEVIHTIKAMAPGGNWIQLRHRLRIASSVTSSLAVTQNGFEDTANVEAQGSTGAPVPGYSFDNMSDVIDDSGLFRAGAGDAQSKTDLGSYDGYVYAVPMFMFHRRNSGNYTVSSQNGTRIDGDAVSGYHYSGKSGHPAGLYYDSIVSRDVLDLRSRVSLTGFNLHSELSRSWQMLIRGELQTFWNQLKYDYNNDLVWEPASVWGTVITQIDQISNSAEALTNPMRDRNVTSAPLALPDGQRNVWSKTPVPVLVKFSFTQGSNVSASPSGFVTYNSGTETLTFNAATLSGAGVGGTKIGITSPVIMRKTDLSVKPTLSTSGLGTQVSSSKMTGLIAAAEYIGYIQVVYPGGSGITYPRRQILSHSVIDNAVTPYPDEQFGTTGVPQANANGLASPYSVARMSTGHYVVADRSNHRIVKVDPTNWTIVASFGTVGVSGATNSTTNSPTGVCVDSSNNVYFCDTGNHRVVKLNSSMAYLSQFGTTNVAGVDTDDANGPTFVATDSTHLFVTDTGNNRLLKIPVSMAAAVDSFGGVTIGAGKSGLNAPLGVAVVNAGFGQGVWVSDSGNKRIVILDSSLNFKYQISDQSSTNTLVMEQIRSVVKDQHGNYYVIAGPFDRAGGQGHCVYKFNSELSLISTFGTPGVPKSDSTGFWGASAVCYDQNNGWLYVADTFNHRVVRLAYGGATGAMTYLAQFGLTGLTQPSASVASNRLCPTPADVAIDSSGNLFVTCNEAHVVKRVAAVSDLSVTTHQFGIPFVPAVSPTSGTNLTNPLGISVKDDGEGTAEVRVVDAGNKRIVRLGINNLTFSGYFVPTYNTSVLPRAIFGMADIHYCSSDLMWYVTIMEQKLGTNPGLYEFSILKFAATPAGTPNYTTRIVSPTPYPTGIFANAANILVGSPSDGIVIFDRTNPTIYEFTKDPTVNIKFKFVDLCGLSSDGTRVLVAEPLVSAVHCFDADIGLYRGSAGLPYEPGTDKSHLNFPTQAMIHDKYLVIVDSKNHRLVRRHISSPWISVDGTITTMLPPVGADKIRIFYDIDAYQGIINSLSDAEAIYKSQVRAESNSVIATTMGLGTPLTALYQEFRHLQGMTVRLPLPLGWSDDRISPIGMKYGTGDEDDDSPYLVAPVTITEGYSGGQSVLPGASSSSPLSSRQVLQQIARTLLPSGGPERGSRTVLPTDKVVPRRRMVTMELTTGIYTAPTIGSGPDPVRSRPIVENYFEVIRTGAPPVRANNLLEAVPHFNYYYFLYQRNGRLMVAVLSQGSFNKDVAIAPNNNSTVIDIFYPFGRLLTR